MMRRASSSTPGGWIRRVVAAAVMAALVGWSTVAMAQTGRSPADEITIPGGTAVIIAYVILWIIFGAVLVAVGYRQSRLQDEIDRLEDKIDGMLGTAE